VGGVHVSSGWYGEFFSERPGREGEKERERERERENLWHLFPFCVLVKTLHIVRKKTKLMIHLENRKRN
jgi:hypothetical protein